MRENFATVLETVSDVLGDHTAIVHGERSVTYAELELRAARLAAYLAERGVGRDSRVAIGLFNGVEYIESVFAAFKLGAVPMNVNYRYREAELTHVLADAGADVLIFNAALDEQVAAVAPELPKLGTLLRLADSGDGPPGAVPYATALTAAGPLARTTLEPGHWLMYTGGTTGAPKGVLSTHSWLFKVAASNGYGSGVTPPGSLAELEGVIRDRRDNGPHLVSLPASPLMHGTGMYCTLGTLVAGGTAVFLGSRSYDPAEVLRLVAEHRITVLSIVGDAFARPLADFLDAEAAKGVSYDLSSVERIASVGVTWSADVKERLLRHGDFVCSDVVAASEGGPFAISLTRRGEHAVTSRFELTPGTRLVTEDGRDVLPGSGEVGLLAAPTDDEIAYHGDAAKTAEAFRYIDGRRYCVPGDLATLEADGSLTFKGRHSRVINTGGEKVFAEEVEQVLLQHPQVDDVYVIGVPDERWGNRIAAVVASETDPETDELREFVAARLARYKAPRSVVVVRELRRSPAGKADLKWARQQLAEAPSQQA